MSSNPYAPPVFPNLTLLILHSFFYVSSSTKALRNTSSLIDLLIISVLIVKRNVALESCLKIENRHQNKTIQAAKYNPGQQWMNKWMNLWCPVGKSLNRLVVARHQTIFFFFSSIEHFSALKFLVCEFRMRYSGDYNGDNCSDNDSGDAGAMREGEGGV